MAVSSGVSDPDRRRRGWTRVGRSSRVETRGRTGLWVIVCLALLALWPLGFSSYNTFVMAVALAFGLLAMSLDLQWGYAGLINFGPAAYFGVGGYAYALATTKTHALGSAYVALVIAMVVGALLALITGYPAFRARVLPMYYALITLATALLLGEYATIADAVGGSNGIDGLPPLDFSIPGLFHWTALSQVGSFYVALAFVALVFAVVLWIVSQPFGRVIRAIRDDEVKCETLGYNTMRYKLILTGIAGAVGGLAGGLYVGINGSVDPSIFGAAISIQTFVWVAVGGQGTLWGPLAATIILQLGENELSAISVDLYLIIIAAIFVIAVLVLPQGIAGGLTQLGRGVAARHRLLPWRRGSHSRSVEHTASIE